MTKVPYITGVKAEYRARDELKSQGYYVMRSAGSHGLFDLIAISADYVKLIQVKVISFGEKKKFKKERMDLGYVRCPESCLKELWVWEKHGKWQVYKIPSNSEYLKGKK